MLFLMAISQDPPIFSRKSLMEIVAIIPSVSKSISFENLEYFLSVLVKNIINK